MYYGIYVDIFWNKKAHFTSLLVMAVMFLVRKYVERQASPTITQVVIKTRRGFPTLGHSWPAPPGPAARQSKSHWRQCAPPRSSAIPPPFPPSTALRAAWRPLIEFSKLGDGTTIEQAAGPPTAHKYGKWRFRTLVTHGSGIPRQIRRLSLSWNTGWWNSIQQSVGIH